MHDLVYLAFKGLLGCLAANGRAFLESAECGMRCLSGEADFATNMRTGLKGKSR